MKHLSISLTKPKYIDDVSAENYKMLIKAGALPSEPPGKS